MEDDFESVGEFGEVDLADLRCWWCEGKIGEVDVRDASPPISMDKTVCIIPEIPQFWAKGLPNV